MLQIIVAVLFCQSVIGHDGQETQTRAHQFKPRVAGNPKTALIVRDTASIGYGGEGDIIVESVVFRGAKTAFTCTHDGLGRKNGTYSVAVEFYPPCSGGTYSGIVEIRTRIAEAGGDTYRKINYFQISGRSFRVDWQVRHEFDNPDGNLDLTVQAFCEGVVEHEVIMEAEVGIYWADSPSQAGLRGDLCVNKMRTTMNLNYGRAVGTKEIRIPPRHTPLRFGKEMPPFLAAYVRPIGLPCGEDVDPENNLDFYKAIGAVDKVEEVMAETNLPKSAEFQRFWKVGSAKYAGAQKRTNKHDLMPTRFNYDLRKFGVTGRWIRNYSRTQDANGGTRANMRTANALKALRLEIIRTTENINTNIFQFGANNVDPVELIEAKSIQGTAVQGYSGIDDLRGSFGNFIIFGVPNGTARILETDKSRCNVRTERVDTIAIDSFDFEDYLAGRGDQWLLRWAGEDLYNRHYRLWRNCTGLGADFIAHSQLMPTDVDDYVDKIRFE